MGINQESALKVVTQISICFALIMARKLGVENNGQISENTPL
jgi:hypothetical protein